MPTNNWPTQSQCDSYYGNPRGTKDNYNVVWAKNNLVHVACPWHLKMGKISIPYITIHKKCASSLMRILNAIWIRCGKNQKTIEKFKFDQFSGSFNYRPKRGSRSLSMHAYGVAIDWDAAENPFRSKRHLFQANTILVEEFEKEGWNWGGRWSSPDAMHVQAARIR